MAHLNTSKKSTSYDYIDLTESQSDEEGSPKASHDGLTATLKEQWGARAYRADLKPAVAQQRLASDQGLLYQWDINEAKVRDSSGPGHVSQKIRSPRVDTPEVPNEAIFPLKSGDVTFSSWRRPALLVAEPPRTSSPFEEQKVAAAVPHKWYSQPVTAIRPANSPSSVGDNDGNKQNEMSLDLLSRSIAPHPSEVEQPHPTKSHVRPSKHDLPLQQDVNRTTVQAERTPHFDDNFNQSYSLTSAQLLPSSDQLSRSSVTRTTEDIPRSLTKRGIDGGIKAVSSDPSRRNVSDEHSAGLLPLNWDPSLPSGIIAFLSALRQTATSSGKPRRTIAKELLLDAGSNYFGKNGDLKATAPVWDFTLEQLGISEEGWRYLIRKDKPVIYPGPGARARLGRPSAKLDKDHQDQVYSTKSIAHGGPLEPPSRSHASTGSVPDASRLHTPPDTSSVESSEYSEHLRVAEDRHRLRTGTGASQAVARPSTNRKTEELVSRVRAVFTANMAHVRCGNWVPEEDALLVHLKEDLNLPWPRIGTYFTYRSHSWHTLQSRYSLKFANRNNGLPLPQTSSRLRVSADVGLDSSDLVDVAQSRKSARLGRKSNPNISYRPADYFAKVLRQGVQADAEGSDEDSHDPDLVAYELGTGHASRSSFRGGVDGPSMPHTGSTVYDRASAACISRAPRSLLPAPTLQLHKDRDAAALAGGLLRISRKPKSPAQDLHRIALMKTSNAQKRRSVDIYRPYLGSSERKCLNDSIKHEEWDESQVSNWDGTAVHVDFTEEEIDKVDECLHSLGGINISNPGGNFNVHPHQRVRAIADYMCRIRTSGEKCNLDALVPRIARRATGSSGILNRTEESIANFLFDAITDSEDAKRGKPQAALQRIKLRRREPSIHRALRYRELSSTAINIARRHPSIKAAMHDFMGPLLRFTGTSSDVNAVAWAPNCSTFAAGSAALTDPHSMQYNRPNNLLLGDIADKKLKELPSHATRREMTEAGANSSREMFVCQDPLLFQSVSAVGFSTDGSAMISTGYDNFVRVFDLRSGFSTSANRFSFRDKSPIDLLALNNQGLFAIGSQSASKSVRVFRSDLDADAKDLKLLSLTSPRSASRPDQNIYPSSLKWGHPIHDQSKYLLCGFSSNLKDFGEGEACVWDVESQQRVAVARGSRTVFDVAWSPSIFGRFALATIPSSHVNKGTQSVVDIYDSRLLGGELHVDPHRTCELECPALDVNDIIFNPKDDFMVSAGCTDGSIYVWDLRSSDELLHHFTHGQPAIELDDSRAREEVDTGVRFLSWNAARRGLVSGSSDGVVAIWDPYRAPEDAHTYNLAELASGVMSGAFNNDFSALLLGEVNGSVNVFTVGRDNEDDFEEFHVERAGPDTMEEVYGNLKIDVPQQVDSSGITAANDLVQSGAISFAPFGDLPIRQAVRGPAYNGPYDKSLDAPLLREQAAQMQRKFVPSPRPCRLVHELPRLTEEEMGDDKSSEKRIPESYRFLPADVGRKALGHSPCQRCGRNEDIVRWKAGNVDDMAACYQCHCAWRIDLLGNTPLDVVTAAPLQIPSTKALHQRQPEPANTHETVLQALTNDDNELQAMDDYVHSFWQDRPASPL